MLLAKMLWINGKNWNLWKENLTQTMTKAQPHLQPTVKRSILHVVARLQVPSVQKFIHLCAPVVNGRLQKTSVCFKTAPYRLLTLLFLLMAIHFILYLTTPTVLEGKTFGNRNKPTKVGAFPKIWANKSIPKEMKCFHLSATTARSISLLTDK